MKAKKVFFFPVFHREGGQISGNNGLFLRKKKNQALSMVIYFLEDEFVKDGPLGS